MSPMPKSFASRNNALPTSPRLMAQRTTTARLELEVLELIIASRIRDRADGHTLRRRNMDYITLQPNGGIIFY